MGSFHFSSLVRQANLQICGRSKPSCIQCTQGRWVRLLNRTTISLKSLTKELQWDPLNPSGPKYQYTSRNFVKKN